MEHKAVHRFEVKDDARGEIVAVFSTFDVVDADGDVTRRGAFADNGPVVMSAYGHRSWDGALPVGKGTIRELKTEAVADLRVFLDTRAGADTFTTIKELGDLQEWSYGYQPLEFSFGEHDGKQVRFLERVKVFEVSPVLRGAGVGTRTVSAKSKFSEHAQRRLQAEMQRQYLRFVRSELRRAAPELFRGE